MDTIAKIERKCFGKKIKFCAVYQHKKLVSGAPRGFRDMGSTEIISEELGASS